MKSEILEAVLVLKEYENDPKLKGLKEDLEHAIKEELLGSLKNIQLVGSRLGYNIIQELLKDSQKIVKDLEEDKQEGEE